VPASEIVDRATLLTLQDDGAVAQVTSDAFIPDVDVAPVYNITVDGTHNYFASGVLVHNKEAPPCPSYDWNTGLGCDRALSEIEPACEAYPSAMLTSAEYAGRLRRWFGADLVQEAAIDPTSPFPRNQILAALFGAPDAPGRVIARLLRVPSAVQARAGTTGSLDLELASKLVENAGTPLTDPIGGRLADLLHYRQAGLTAALTQFYAPPQTADADAIDPTDNQPRERIGVLTEGAFLRSHPTPSDRGRVIGEQMLCGLYLPHVPPVTLPAQAGTRYDAHAELAANALCGQCHDAIDGLGLALERFDATGSYRPTEAGELVLNAGWLADGVELDGPAGMADALLVEPMLATCLSRSLLADALGRPLTPADECSVQWIVENMTEDLDMREAILAVVTSPSFVHANAP
jgi:hypothetical protein